ILPHPEGDPFEAPVSSSREHAESATPPAAISSMEHVDAGAIPPNGEPGMAGELLDDPWSHVAISATSPEGSHPAEPIPRPSASQAQALEQSLRRLKYRRTHTPVSAVRRYRSTSCIKPLDIIWSTCSARPSTRISPRCSHNLCRTCWTPCATWCRRKCQTCLKCCSNRKLTNSSKPSSKTNMIPKNARH